MSNVAFEGITFTGKVNIASSMADTVIDGVTFKDCEFTLGSTCTDNQALRYYNEINNGKVRNLVVDSCSFTNCYQGVYTSKINGIKVVDSSFDTTGHNAIAVQNSGGACDHGAVIITGNEFNNIGDRIIRFNEVGADTQITIKNNTAANFGDENGEVMKAQSLADGITYDISGDSWGDGKIVHNEVLHDR